MGINALIVGADLFFLLFARIFALLSVAPLTSSQALPTAARAGLALLTAVTIFPWAQAQGGWVIPDNGWVYAALIGGEVLLGLFQGFVMLMVFSVFQMSGQLFSTPMGFGASEVFDPMSQIELPLIGQFFNLAATMVFLSVQGLQKLFFTGVFQSFQALKASDFLTNPGDVSKSLLTAFADLFQRSLIISLPILGVLLLVSVTMGLLGKAAPQMNLMMVGFPISITVGFIIIILVLPFLTHAFGVVIDRSFELMLTTAGAQPGTVPR